MTLHQAAQKALEALQLAHAGLEWYRDRFSEVVDGSDEEADEKIGDALAALESALQQQPEPVSGVTIHLTRDPATGEVLRTAPPALQEVLREPVADFAMWPDVRNRGLLQSAKQALAALDRQALLPWGTPGYPTHSPTAAIVGEARSYLKPAIDREEAFRVGAMGEDPMVAHGGFPAPLAASPSTTQQPSVADHALNTTPVVDHATQQQEAGSRDIVTLGGGIPGDPSGELTAICKGLVSAVAYGENREVSALFDAPEQAHAFVRYLQRFVGNGVAAAPSTPEASPLGPGEDEYLSWVKLMERDVREQMQKRAAALPKCKDCPGRASLMCCESKPPAGVPVHPACQEAGCAATRNAGVGGNDAA